MREPIFITGAARSGTSMIAGVVDICGGFGGLMTGPTPYNEKGQFENTRIRQTVVKPYLQLMGVDPLCQDPLPDVDNLMDFPELRGKIQDTMLNEGYVNGPWYYKGAKMCLIWPTFARAFPNARWLIARRNAMGIAVSCQRTSFMRRRKSVESWRVWVRVHEQRFEEMKGAGLDVTEVRSEDMINGDLGAIREFVDGTDGLEWNQAQVDEFITPDLWERGRA